MKSGMSSVNNAFKAKAVVMDFPELGGNKKKENMIMKADEKKPIDYVDILKTEEPQITIKKETLEEGHVRYTRDSTNGTLIVESNYYPPTPKQGPSYNEFVNRKLEVLFQRWEEHKRETIELKGEDYYARISSSNPFDNTDESEAAPEDLEDDELDW